MKRFNGARLVVLLLLLISATCGVRAKGSSAPNLPPRDYLTPQEVDLVKEAQILDKRIEVFIKAAERRLGLITGQVAAPTKQSQKDAEKWGDLPKGTRAELITDIARILDAAITNIDDVALRDEKNPLLPKALRKLAEAATRIGSQLATVNSQTKEKTERLAIEQVSENVEEILAAAGRLPPPSQPTKK